MPSLKSLRLRIRSITSTQKIIKAMQMISASRLRQVRNYADNIVTYKDSLELLTQRVFKDSQLDLSNQFWAKSFAALKYVVETKQHLPASLTKTINRDSRAKLLIFITTERGLCGSYNSQLIRRVGRYLEEQNTTISAICIGKKGHDILKKNPKVTIISEPLPSLKSKSLEYSEASKLIIEPILAELAKSNFSSCDIVYTQYISTLVQKPVCLKLMPFDTIFDMDRNKINDNELQLGNIESSIAKVANQAIKTQQPEPLYEPKIEHILPTLLYQYIETIFYEVIIESLLSEHASRMVAMDGAYRNSKKILDRLNSQYNRGRQSNITRELIEIISGNDAIQTG